MSAEPVPEAGLPEHFNQVASMQAQQVLSWRMAATTKYWALRCSMVANAAMAFALAWTVPNVQVVPVFVYTNSMGAWDTTTELSALPATTQIAGIEGSVWEYVRRREHYSPSEADQSYAIVSAMSSSTVREQYQRWANPKNNKEAPAAVLNKDPTKPGFIRMHRISGRFDRRNEDYSAGVYIVKFCRVVVPQAGSPIAQRMEVAVGYQLVQSVPVLDRRSFNHAGIVVTEYPRPEPEGRGPGTLINVMGSDNPCT